LASPQRVALVSTFTAAVAATVAEQLPDETLQVLEENVTPAPGTFRPWPQHRTLQATIQVCKWHPRLTLAARTIDVALAPARILALTTTSEAKEAWCHRAQSLSPARDFDFGEAPPDTDLPSTGRFLCRVTRRRSGIASGGMLLICSQLPSSYPAEYTNEIQSNNRLGP